MAVVALPTARSANFRAPMRLPKLSLAVIPHPLLSEALPDTGAPRWKPMFAALDDCELQGCELDELGEKWC